MDINDYISRIKKLGACEDAVKQAHNYQTSQQLWDDCKRGDWMLWLIGKLSGEPQSNKRRRLVITICKCARLALPYAGKNKDVALKTIETAEKWANNQADVTIIDLNAASAAASAAADAADAAYAVDADAAANAAAADAAANAAYAAAVYATANAANAAYAAAAYATAYAADAAAEKILAKCADIVRADYPNVDELW